MAERASAQFDKQEVNRPRKTTVFKNVVNLLGYSTLLLVSIDEAIGYVTGKQTILNKIGTSVVNAVNSDVDTTSGIGDPVIMPQSEMTAVLKDPKVFTTHTPSPTFVVSTETQTPSATLEVPAPSEESIFNPENITFAELDYLLSEQYVVDLYNMADKGMLPELPKSALPIKPGTITRHYLDLSQNAFYRKYGMTTVFNIS